MSADPAADSTREQATWPPQSSTSLWNAYARIGMASRGTRTGERGLRADPAIVVVVLGVLVLAATAQLMIAIGTAILR